MSTSDQALEGRFHLMGRIEGASMLALVFIAMPLKYFANQPMAVTIVGSLHGLLWLLYLLMLALVWVKLRWPFSKVFVAGVASVLPFGPWWFERWAQRPAEA